MYNKKEMRECALSFLGDTKLTRKQMNELAEELMEKEKHVNNAGYTINNDDMADVVKEYLGNIYEEE